MPDPEPALSDVVDVVDPTPYLKQVDRRFGIPPSTFDDYVFVRPNSKKVHLVPRDHRPPSRPEPMSLGMPFIRTYLKYPKLTTAAAMTFGHAATRNVVPADEEQLTAFLTRRPFEASAAQTKSCTGRGYVLVRFKELTLGVGFYKPSARGGIVNSMMPKVWARNAGAFDVST